LRRLVGLPQPKGAGGVQPTWAVGRVHSACVGHSVDTALELRQANIAAEAATAKNRDTRAGKRQRELHDLAFGIRR
jgi:hypothetical protein